MYNIIFLILLICLICYYIYNHYHKNELFTETNVDNIFNIYDNFITDEECEILIKLAEGKFKKSTIISQHDNIVDTNVRTSSSTYFKHDDNYIIEKIENNISRLLNINKNHMEPIQIQKYEKGEQYKLHYDFFNKESEQYKNQRVNTIIIYLNDLNEEDGGATTFPYLNKKFQPSKGRALEWNNINYDGNGNTLLLHAGEPILTDKIKYILTIWTRLNPY